MTETKEAGKSPWRYEKKNVWDVWDHGKILAYAEGYRRFLDACKTERECIRTLIREAEAAGFEPFDAARVSPGTRFYRNNRGKGLVLGVVGSDPLEAGVRLVGAHVDAPRLDLKTQPLYQEEGLALLKTHYYGGIKKYQWLAIPLAIHGVLALENGEILEITVGEEDGDPVFTIPDLLPHLSREQMKKPMSQAVEGEGLNVLAGARPRGETGETDRVKNAILEVLHDRYGIREEDFISAELEIVPAGRAREVGFDRSLLGSYAHDDRVCAYAACRALWESGGGGATRLVLLTDKEETGSFGDTGAQSRFLEYTVASLAEACGLHGPAAVGRILENSRALSADVSAAVDPNHKDLFDAHNAPALGCGVILTKYTGAGGKYEANDASAEYMGEIRALLNRNGIVWQTGELGKVDQGGGGTIAMYLSGLGIQTVDCGPALLGMHSPFEVADKGDILMAFETYRCFLEGR